MTRRDFFKMANMILMNHLFFKHAIAGSTNSMELDLTFKFDISGINIHYPGPNGIVYSADITKYLDKTNKRLVLALPKNFYVLEVLATKKDIYLFRCSEFKNVKRDIYVLESGIYVDKDNGIKAEVVNFPGKSFNTKLKFSFLDIKTESLYFTFYDINSGHLYFKDYKLLSSANGIVNVFQTALGLNLGADQVYNYKVEGDRLKGKVFISSLNADDLMNELTIVENRLKLKDAKRDAGKYEDFIMPSKEIRGVPFVENIDDQQEVIGQYVKFKNNNIVTIKSVELRRV